MRMFITFSCLTLLNAGCTSLPGDARLYDCLSVTDIEFNKRSGEVVSFTILNRLNRTVHQNEEMIRWLPLYVRFTDSNRVEWALNRLRPENSGCGTVVVLKFGSALSPGEAAKFDCQDLSGVCRFAPVNWEHLRQPVGVSYPIEFSVHYGSIGRVWPMQLDSTADIDIHGSGIVTVR